jgi:hypothetical protein
MQPLNIVDATTHTRVVSSLRCVDSPQQDLVRAPVGTRRDCSSRIPSLVVSLKEQVQYNNYLCRLMDALLPTYETDEDVMQKVEA